MKSLVLAEKPSVGKEIARVLGSTQKQKGYFEGAKYVVTWALGHLVTLAEPEDYDAKYKTWNLEDLPILPQKMNLKVMKETGQQYRVVSQLMRRGDISELIIATDAGREGELVARWIMETVHWRKPFKRLWISSQTDKAIKDGFANLKPGAAYNNLFSSAVCRAEADWLIGLNITRALTSKYNAQLAAGRVQTPTLSTLIERENEIKDFRSVDYWTIHADFGSFKAMWRERGGQNSRLFDKVKAEAIVQKAQKQSAKAVSVKTAEKTIPQPLAYDLTELQRDANKRYGFSAKQTSSILQKLYEQHKLVTYPRTDSRYLTSDMAPTLKGRLESIAVGPYAAIVKPLLHKPLNITKRVVDDSKVTDHHAIIPTEQNLQLSALNNEERRLYDIIARRFIALFYPAYRYDETSIIMDVGGESFFAKGKVPKLRGWKDAYGVEALSGDDTDDNEDNDIKEQLLPEIKNGDAFTVKNCSLRNERTQPPARYTEASLLTEMEKHNLGTSATRADIIEKLISTDTIERSLNRLQPTGKGHQLIELVASELRSPELTAEWERELERIAKGTGNMDKFLIGIRQQTSAMVKSVKNSTIEYKAHNITHSKCPECGKNLQEFKGKRGKMLVCPDRDCGFRRAAEAQLSNKRCLQCRKKMEIHTGKAGKYAQCRGCNVIEMLSDSSGGRSQKRDNAQLVQQYSDNTGIGNSLGDALKQAMQKQKED